ncbi:MAG: ADP-ribosylation factor-like protein [Promethearchaeati archaeon]
MAKKVAFLGLDNAGKTSFIISVTKRFGFEEEVMELLPTRRIDRDTFKFLGLELVSMDFGGQEQYREQYLKNPGKYLGGTDLIFYVIDVQDPDRYIESIDYLDQVLLFFKEIKQNPPMAVLFHKFDPEIVNDKDINQKVLTLKQALTKYSNDFDIFFFETTIYDIKSIMDAFSSGLSLLFSKLELVSQLFQEISKNYDAILMALFDAKGITIGEYYKPHLQIHEKMRIYDAYLETQKRIISENKTMYEFSDKFEDGRRFSGVVEVLTFGNLDFYLLIIIEENKEDLGQTVEVLNKIEAAKPEMENIIYQIIQ